MGSLAPTHADLLPPRKRFRDSYSSEASIEEDTRIDPIETEVDMELGIGDGDDVKDHVEIDPRDVRDDTEGYEADTNAGDTVEVGIDPMSASTVKEEIVEPAGEDSFDSFGTRDGIVRSFEDMPIDLNDAVRDFYHHMSEVCIDRIVGIETVQRRNCPEKSQVKYVTCTLLDNALTWWNSHKRTIGTEAAFAMSWKELMKLMTEILRVNHDVYQNGPLGDRVEKFIGGLPDNIQGNVIVAEPIRLQDVARIANNLMDQKLKGYAVRNAENKRRLNNNYRNNCG
ncbi:hypothetical protein Tco_1542856 [Tanacetum coccineum]